MKTDARKNLEMPGEQLPVYVWAPCAAGLAVLLMNVAYAISAGSLWPVFGGQVEGLAAFLLVRCIFPRPTP